MESADATPRAVVYSALLHLGIVAFLALAMLNCTRWEGVADALPFFDPPLDAATADRLKRYAAKK